MKLSARARHAVRLMLEVHRKGGGQNPVKLSEIAKVTGISVKFLEQLVISLKSHALLRGICGRHGGYLLSRPADQITIGDVLRAVLGPIDLAVCAGDIPVCMSSEFCDARVLWRLLRLRINAVLDSYTIADLADRHRMAAIRAEVQHQEEDALAAARARLHTPSPSRLATAQGR